jgi:HK97 family phage major capsid protein
MGGPTLPLERAETGTFSSVWVTVPAPPDRNEQSMSTVSAGFLHELENRRHQIRSTAENLLLSARAAGRETLNEREAAQHAQALSDLRGLDDRIADMRADLERSGLGRYAHLSQATSPTPRTPGRPAAMTTLHPSTVYRPNYGPSWLRDLMRTQLNRDENGESRARLARHADDIANSDLEYRDISRVDGQGGYAVPPAWLMDQYIELARPGMAFAAILQQQPLPGGTDSINIPKLLTGTTTAVQTADNTAISNTDLTDTFINAPVRTIAGGQSVAIQLIDQSPIQFDAVIFADLTADHAMQLDRQCLSGTGAGGQILGVLNTAGIGSIAIGGAGQPAIGDYYAAIANAIQLIHTTRFAPPTHVVMHPRRWGHLLSLLDQNNRPLFLPADQAPFNAGGILENVAAENVVGRVAGLPIVTDANITTTAGGSPGNQDVIIVLRAPDVVLWRSGIRARVMPEVGAQTLTVWLDLYSYCALGTRYPASIVEISGLIPPTW